MGPFSLGLLAVGGIAAIKGLFEDDPEYTAPSFKDINLAQENPELYQQLLAQNQLLGMLEQQYKARNAEANNRRGYTQSENIELGQGLGGIDQQLAERGLLGSGAGVGARAQAEIQMRDAINQRIMQDQMQKQQQANMLLNQLMQGRNQQTNNFQQGQNSIMDGRQAQAQARYQGDVHNQQAQNQFFNGLLGAGLQSYGNQQNMDAMGASIANRSMSGFNPYSPIPTFNAVPGIQSGYGPSNIGFNAAAGFGQ